MIKDATVLTIQDLNVSYGQLGVLHDVSLEIREGEIVSLIGANAAGKSTFLNAISQIVPIESGQIRFNTEPIHEMGSDEIIELGIIQVPEGRRVFPFMSVQDNLDMGSFNLKARDKRKASLSKVYDLFPRLAERRKQLAGSMSGGEQQMLAVGRGLMAVPRILMLDEPSLGLAPLIVQSIFDVLEQVNRDGVTVLLVEQNVKRSLGLADRGYVLENGRVVLEGAGSELLQNTHLKKAYLGI
jgi:branched-chain amino acid transport system ATP-binding protein